MAQINNQGKYMMGLLEKIRTYSGFAHHKPKIVTGIDTYIDYIDYYFIPLEDKKAPMLALLTIMPMPGNVFYHDYILLLINPNMITSVLYDTYYDFPPSSVSLFETEYFNISDFYRAILRIASYGCLNWGLPFNQFAARLGPSMYLSAIKSLDCLDNSIFTTVCDTQNPDFLRPISRGSIASSYEDINVFFIPFMHIDKIGGQLGIFPSELMVCFNTLIKSRLLDKKPADWLSAKERRHKVISPYKYSDTVFSQKTLKSFISLIDNNIGNPDDEDSIKYGKWKKIEYKKPGSLSNVPSSLQNPLEDLLSIFGKPYDADSLFS
jgi:hypothetical protein